MGRSFLSLLLLAPSFLCAQSPAGGLTPEQWRSDLAFLAKELPARHIKPFATISQSDFEAEVRDLDGRIPSLQTGAIQAGLLKLVASIGDGHTTIQGWGGESPFHNIPLVFYWYKDGIFVVGATEPYRDLTGSKLLKVGSLAVEEACRRLAVFVSHENDAQLRSMTPNMLMNAELLQEVGAARSGPVTLELEPPSGERRVVEFEPVALRRPVRWIWAYQGEPPLYQRDQGSAYSATVIDDGATVYFRYNRCADDPQKPFPQFAEELKKTLAQPAIKRLIIDLRNNSGGNSAVLDPFITWLNHSPYNKKDKLYVVIGRATFSSAILNAIRLHNETAAILVGEPTGGKPNHFGEVKILELPNSHIRVGYSTKYFHGLKADTPSLMPDRTIELSSHDFLSGADPVLSGIH